MMEDLNLVVTIDGPAGAGKSSVCRSLAERLGFRFLDTGAMYRAIAWAAMRQDVDWEDPKALDRVAEEARIEFDGDRVLLDGRDVSVEIRTPEVTALVRHVADHPSIRRRMVRRQREIARGQDVITEGRDQGTVAFADSPCKIYLTATAEERARRRVDDFRDQGVEVDYDEVLRQINERDRRDKNREVGALVAAADAVRVVTDGMSIDQVIDRLEQIVRNRMASRPD